jgi:hypothetical protein
MRALDALPHDRCLRRDSDNGLLFVAKIVTYTPNVGFWNAIGIIHPTCRMTGYSSRTGLGKNADDSRNLVWFPQFRVLSKNGLFLVR